MTRTNQRDVGVDQMVAERDQHGGHTIGAAPPSATHSSCDERISVATCWVSDPRHGDFRHSRDLNAGSADLYTALAAPGDAGLNGVGIGSLAGS